MGDAGLLIDVPSPFASFPFAWEKAAISRGYLCVAGVDEAGRGPLAGPVVAAAVVFPDHSHPEGIADSKALTATQRDRLFQLITETCACGVGVVSAGEIDDTNILKATHKAMRLALKSLPVPADYALVDGLPVLDLPIPHQSLVKGERRSVSIAAASIIAKVTRDRMMVAMHERYPVYGFDRHKGYPTPSHIRVLEEHGPCAEHRRSFGPVRRVCGGNP